MMRFEQHVTLKRLHARPEKDHDFKIRRNYDACLFSKRFAES